MGYVSEDYQNIFVFPFAEGFAISWTRCGEVGNRYQNQTPLPNLPTTYCKVDTLETKDTLAARYPSGHMCFLPARRALCVVAAAAATAVSSSTHFFHLSHYCLCHRYVLHLLLMSKASFCK